MGKDVWDGWISDIDKVNGLSIDEKVKAKEAFSYLNQILGDDFSDTIIEDNHPLIRHIINLAPWTRRWVVSLVDALRICTDLKNGDKIVDMLKDPRRYNEAILHMYIIKCMVSAGFEVEFLKENNVNKVVDIKIMDKDSHEIIPVEFTELNRSLRAKQLSNTLDPITDKLFEAVVNHKLIYNGRIYVPFLSEPLSEEILKNICTAIETAKTDGFAIFTEDEILKVAIAKNDKKDLLQDWVNGNNLWKDDLTTGFIATNNGSYMIRPKEITDETGRLIGKIDYKSTQLSTNPLNILIIRADNFFLNTKDIVKKIRTIQQYVYNRSDLAICILVGGYIGGIPNPQKINGNNFCYMIKTPEVITKHIAIMVNSFSRDHAKTKLFAPKIESALENCNTLLY